jgi:ribose/xylose/arabinose/galactoside ABC-type transport system permease subunit
MNQDTLLKHVKNQKSLVILVLIAIVTTIISPMFITASNIQNLMMQISIQGIVGFGMTFCLLVGEFDMSVGSILTLAGIIFAKLMPMIGFVASIIVTIIVASILGFINGTLVSRMGLSSFIGTLGAMYAYKGIALMISGGEPTAVTNDIVLGISNFKLFQFAIHPYIFIIVGIICAYVLTRTRFGRNIYATGGNTEVAKNSGINVHFYKTMAFVIVCASAGLAGILLTIRLQSATPIAGDDLNLVVISSIIIGGTSPSGGIGSIQKSCIGLFIIGIVTNGLGLMGISGYYQQVVQGLLTVLIVGGASFANYRNVSELGQ